MADHSLGTNRRSFLKSGAIVAAPLAVIAAPAAALAGDDSPARLARLEDERAIDALHRATLRRINADPAAAAHLAEGLRTIAEHPLTYGSVELDAAAGRATCRRPVRVEIERAFTGDSTLEQMARFQGQGSHRHSEERVLATEYVKDRAGWRIAAMRLA